MSEAQSWGFAHIALFFDHISNFFDPREGTVLNFSTVYHLILIDNQVIERLYTIQFHPLHLTVINRPGKRRPVHLRSHSSIALRYSLHCVVHGLHSSSSCELIYLLTCTIHWEK